MTVWAEEGLSCRGFPVAPKRSEGGFVHYDNGRTAEVSLVVYPRVSTREVYPPWRAEEFKEMTARIFLSCRSLSEGGLVGPSFNEG